MMFIKCIIMVAERGAETKNEKENRRRKRKENKMEWQWQIMQTCARHCFSRPAQEGKGKDDGWCYCWAFKGIRFEREEKKERKKKEEKKGRLGWGVEIFWKKRSWTSEESSINDAAGVWMGE